MELTSRGEKKIVWREFLKRSSYMGLDSLPCLAGRRSYLFWDNIVVPMINFPMSINFHFSFTSNLHVAPKLLLSANHIVNKQNRRIREARWRLNDSRRSGALWHFCPSADSPFFLFAFISFFSLLMFHSGAFKWYSRYSNAMLPPSAWSLHHFEVTNWIGEKVNFIKTCRES